MRKMMMTMYGKTYDYVTYERNTLIKSITREQFLNQE